MSSAFDAYAEQYERDLEKGIGLSGESAAYFADERARRTASWWPERIARPRRILDFGCGTGGGFPGLLREFRPAELAGFDVSARSLEVAGRLHPGKARLLSSLNAEAGGFDLVFCNGVFHHIAPEHRAEVLAMLQRSLKPGGVFALWENNPWNLATRIVMARIPFDRDAVLLSPSGARRLLAENGFQPILTRSAFYFPRFLRLLRPLERPLASLPLGCQYLVLAARR